MVRDQHTYRNSLSTAYPNIRLLDQDAVALMSNNELWSLDRITNEIPLLILNQNEVTREDVRRLKPFYRHIYANPCHVLNSLQYEEIAAKRAASTLPQRQKEWFRHIYPSAADSEITSFFATTAQGQQKYLEDMYARDYYYSEINGHLVSRVRDHFLESQKAEFSSDAMQALLGALKEKAVPEETIAQALESAQSTFETGLKKQRADRRKKLADALNDLPEPLLRVMNAHGVNIALVDAQSGANRGMSGVSRDNPALIMIDSDALENKDIFIEEIIHYVDHLLGTTARREWIESAQADMRRANTRLFMDQINDACGKDTVFNTFIYQEHMIPCELLPDLQKADANFDKIIDAIRENAPLNDLDPDSQNLRPLMRAIKRFSLPDGSVDKEALMTHYFPKTWPLYKAFVEELNSYRSQLTNDPADPNALWTDRVATGDAKSPQIPNRP